MWNGLGSPGRGAIGVLGAGQGGRCLVVCLLLACGWPAAGQEQAPQMPSMRIVAAAVEQRELATGQTFVGTVMPLRASTVGSAVEGKVVEFLVDEGDAVEQGDPLARLRTRQLEIQLAGAQAELASREQELAELENGSRPEEIAQAQARMLGAKALWEFSAAQLERNRTLFARRAVSEDELQDKVSAAENAEQKYLEYKVAWELAVAGPRKEQIAKAKAQVAFQREEIRRLEDEIAEHTITAPFDGYVAREHTEVGQWIAKGAPVAEVVELKSVEVEASVPGVYLPRLRLGIGAQVTIGALPGQLWEGPVVAIVPQGDVRSRSFPVKVRLQNQPGPDGGLLLKPGMFARVTLPVGERGRALLVPKDAVVLGGQAPVVYAVTSLPPEPPTATASVPGAAPEGVARLVPVELGAMVGELIEVRGQLQPGDLVVVEGNERLFPGMPLSVVRVDKTPQSEAAGS